MNIKKLIFLIVFLSVANTYAQDTTYVNKVAEQVSPLVTLRDEMYSSPALRPFYRNYNYALLAANLEKLDKDLYLKQEGSGYNSFRINSESFIKNITGISLWGKAYYNNEKIRQVNFNETLDYHYVYPYVMADTIGGDLNTETYYFGGGLSKKIGGLRYAFQGSFKGIQSFRNRDPRPKNISSDVNLSLSVAKELSKNKALSFDLNLQKYNQDNGLTFVRELGFPLVYHDAGLGVYNEILAGTRLQAYYKGSRLGAQLNFTPTNLNGFSAQLGYHQFQLSKELSSIIDNISEVNEDNIHLALAYHVQSQKQSFIVRLKGAFVKRDGIEATFANIGSTSLYKVAEETRYINEKINVQLNAIYGNTTNKLNWFVGLDGTFANYNENYILPDRFIDYQSLNLGAFISALRPIGKSILNLEFKANYLQILNSDYSWDNVKTNSGIYTMLSDNYEYLSSGTFIISAAARADLPMTSKINLFLKAKATQGTYSSRGNISELAFTVGCNF
ncbi:DUF6850 family outer membrane beta-barrel protein [Pedobacter xixiisoli]|uniref:DUF6850 domain-containing protein n=1 Tax=Pedobacter xixiisoli TaxID=1476464 RepID=A0A285ZRC9_9SPHI|nr:DUF6850 family outer membrane beta-barrel protein [Pedobacter xixiisoli]SOD12188.1 hypothetical protein SAMN06297358_0538 [Pedobacter xixiisoli]